MRLACSRIRRSLIVGALGALALGWAVRAWPAPAGSAEPPCISHCSSGLLAVKGSGSPGSNPDQDEGNWERRLERVENRRLITVAVFLGIVFLILLFWWSWGKIHHRARKL